MRESTEALLAKLRALADPTRLRLVALCRQGECSVSELTRVTGQSQPRVSQQLKALCEAGLLTRFRDGKRVFYRVPREADAGSDLQRLLDLVPDDDPVFSADRRLLEKGRGERIGDFPADRHDEAAQRVADRVVIFTIHGFAARMLAQGSGTPRNCAQAISWAHKAAVAGVAEAALLLGELHVADCNGATNPQEAAR